MKNLCAFLLLIQIEYLNNIAMASPYTLSQTYQTGCSTLDQPLDAEVTLVQGPLVSVTSITVIPQTESQYVVTLRWISPGIDVQNSTRGLRVQWQALSSGSVSSCTAGTTAISGSSTTQDIPASLTTTNDTTHCQILHFLHSSNSSTVVSTTRWCYATDHPSRCQSITLSSLHSNVSLTVTVRMPPNLTVIEDPAAVSEWKTPVSVVVDEEQRLLVVLIQTAPVELNITSYRLTLVNVRDGSTVNSHILEKNETLYTFEDIKTKGIYVVRVEPLGSGCMPPCQYSESANVSLAGAPMALSPTPPTLQSTASATTTASFPTPRPNSPTTTPNDMTLHKTTTATDPSVIVKPAVDQTEYNKSRNIILGTVFGVIFLAIVATGIFCFYGRTRSAHAVSFPMLPRRRRESNSSIIMEDTLKNQPIVLLLYSYDCPAHEVVVTTFAYYLKEVANCEVILDIWDQHNLQEQGVYAWLVDKVDVAQYIILVCSTGARFKCARNREFRMKHDRTLPDVFAWGVDHVAEKIRTATNVAEAKNRYISAYFDYAGRSDIPPKLEITKKFCLMKDIYSLYCHLHSIKAGQSHPHAKHGLTVDTYSKTVDGRPLQDALIDAKHFFKDNPNWLGQTLEPITPVLSASREVSTDNNPDEPSQRPRRVESSSPFVGSEKNPFLLERRIKREREREEAMERIPHFKKQDDLPFSTPGTSPSHVPSDGTSSVTSMSPLMSPAITKPRVVVPAYTASSGTLHSRDLDMEEETDADDTSQMQRDIDFIQNFDAHHTWETKNGSVGHYFVDVDMGVYTPPEDFISLASLEEEANRALANSTPASPGHGSSPMTGKTPSISSGQQYQGISHGPPESSTVSQNSPWKATGIRANSGLGRQASPAPSTPTSVGSPTKLNNHSGGSNNNSGYDPSSPVLTNSSSSLSNSASPQHMNHTRGSRTSLASQNKGSKQLEPVVNSAPASGTSTPRGVAGHGEQHPQSPVSHSPSPPQMSAVSSIHSSPFKGQQAPPTNEAGSRQQQPHAGSTNGHFVVELETSVDPTIPSNA